MTKPNTTFNFIFYIKNKFTGNKNQRRNYTDNQNRTKIILNHKNVDLRGILKLIAFYMQSMIQVKHLGLPCRQLNHLYTQGYEVLGAPCLHDAGSYPSNHHDLRARKMQERKLLAVICFGFNMRCIFGFNVRCRFGFKMISKFEVNLTFFKIIPFLTTTYDESHESTCYRRVAGWASTRRILSSSRTGSTSRTGG